MPCKPMNRIAGVDGSRAGWVVSLADCWPCPTPPHLVICRDFAGVLAVTANCQAIVVDMPIGLPSGSEIRLCDQLARDLLGPAGSSRVFNTPPRAALAAQTPGEFQQRHRCLTGKGAELPVWGIVPKLREVDAAMTPALQGKVFEFHPEVAWMCLSGATLSSKRSEAGRRERLGLLRSEVPCVEELLAWHRALGSAAQGDDLLDALVGLTTAQAIASGPDCSRRLPPDQPPVDERGLRMEMWY